MFGNHNFLQTFMATGDDLQSCLILSVRVSDFEKCSKSAVDLVFREVLNVVRVREIVEEVNLPWNIQLIHLIFDPVENIFDPVCFFFEILGLAVIISQPFDLSLCVFDFVLELSLVFGAFIELLFESFVLIFALLELWSLFINLKVDLLTFVFMI